MMEVLYLWLLDKVATAVPCSSNRALVHLVQAAMCVCLLALVLWQVAALWCLPAWAPAQFSFRVAQPVKMRLAVPLSWQAGLAAVPLSSSVELGLIAQRLARFAPNRRRELAVAPSW